MSNLRIADRITRLSLLVIIFSSISQIAKAQEIRGVVIDELDEALPYVSVVAEYADTMDVFLTDSGQRHVVM